MKQMPRNRIIAIALCLGVVAAVLTWSYLSKQPGKSQMATAVVASRSIPNGTIVDSGMLATKSLPTSEIPNTAATSPDMLIGKIAMKDIKMGDTISLQSVSEKNRLSQMVKPFMRAVTVAVDPVIGVAGFLKPGDHVDVLATFNSNEGTITKTVLQNVQLIAIGSEIVEPASSDKDNQAKPNVQTNATLAVMPADAEKLVLSDTKGKIRLALRRTDDPAYVAVKGVTGRGLMGVVPPDVPVKNVPLPAPMRPLPGPEPTHIGGTDDGGRGNIVAPLPIHVGKTIQVVRGTKVEDTQVPD